MTHILILNNKILEEMALIESKFNLKLCCYLLLVNRYESERKGLKKN